eukprot:jgi/Bigna1/144318/aug1.86_g19026
MSYFEFSVVYVAKACSNTIEETSEAICGLDIPKNCYPLLEPPLAYLRSDSELAGSSDGEMSDDDWSSDGDGEETGLPTLPPASRPEQTTSNSVASALQPSSAIGTAGEEKTIEDGSAGGAQASSKRNRTLAASTVIFTTNNGKRFPAGLALLWSADSQLFTVYLYAQVAATRKVLWTSSTGGRGAASPTDVNFRFNVTPSPGAAFDIVDRGQKVGVAYCNSRGEALRWVFVCTLVRAIVSQQQQPSSSSSSSSSSSHIAAGVDFLKSDALGKKLKTRHYATVSYQAWRINWQTLDQAAQLQFNEQETMMQRLEGIKVKDNDGSSLGGLLKGTKLNEQKLIITNFSSPLVKDLQALAPSPPTSQRTHPGVLAGNLAGVTTTTCNDSEKKNCFVAVLLRPLKATKKKPPSEAKKKGKQAVTTTSSSDAKKQQEGGAAATTAMISQEAADTAASTLELPRRTAPAVKVDLAPLMSAMSDVKANMKELPAIQMSIVQKILSDVLGGFKKGLQAQEVEPGGPAANALKSSLGVLKKALRAGSEVFASANQKEGVTGTLLSARHSFKSFLGEFQALKASGALDTSANVLAEMEGQLTAAQGEIARLRKEKAKSSSSQEKNQGELEQLRKDYTEALQAGMKTETALKEMKAKLEEAEEMREVFEKGLSSMKKAFEDEMIKRRKLEAQNRVLLEVYDVGVPRLWESQVKKILTNLEQKVGKNPAAQLENLVNNPPMDDDDDDD